MTRLYARPDVTHPLEVRTRPAPSGPVPEQFLWRGRLYLVLDVLACWTESGSWWRSPAVAAAASGNEPGPGLETGLGVDDRPQQWWRVEAASGRASASSAGPGVYDLCFEEATATWSLARVQD